MEGRVSTVCPSFTRAMPQLEMAPVQYVSGVVEVTVDCAGVGKRWGTPPSSSITQSALPAVSALVASNKNFFAVEPTGLMIKLIAPEVPPPGAGLNTVTLAVPALATSAALTGAVNCAAFT